MDPDCWREIERLYHAALERDPAGRDAFLRDACHNAPDLHREVEELLAYQERAGGFIETPAVDMVARQDAAVLASEARFRLAAGDRLGPYEILNPLGAGGMGEVYRARDTRLGRSVALKIVAARMAGQAGIRRLEREARAISNLNHPHICALHDIGREGDLDYLVMEYVEGPTLASRLRQGPLPLADVVRAGIQIAEALDYAHRQGIVHRDLKPGNIMLTARGAKLVDFGLARWRKQVDETTGSAPPDNAANLTMTGMMLGTPQYMAPEQIARGPVDARTDIFALGAVLFEMAHGRKAFPGDTATGVVESIRGGAVPSVARRESGVPAALERFIQRCLKSAPAERWQSAGEVLRELQGIERRKRPTGRLAWVSVAALCLTVAAFIIIYLARTAGKTPRAKMEILYSFTGKDGDGASPANSGVTMDAAGALYGFANKGGAYGKGTVYRLSAPPGPGAEWREDVIHNFSGPDGEFPRDAPVIGRDGSLYGATFGGGKEGSGVVFRLTPPEHAASGPEWRETVIHQFTPSTGDGKVPTGVIFGPDGALYGPTWLGGKPEKQFSILYELLPPRLPEGEWQENVLQRLMAPNNGAWDIMVFGKDGYLYGSTEETVFRLMPPSSPGGSWEETVLHRFPQDHLDGSGCEAALAIGRNGELYGTTERGGIGENGTVFELRPRSGPMGGWTYNVLHRFASHAGDGAQPRSGLLLGPGGVLYGATKRGGAWGLGTIYKLMPPPQPGGPWTEAVLYDFTGQRGDGAHPESNPHLIFDNTGALCGTTVLGGAFNAGAVFRLVLPERP
ncbi:MAG: choice-of-anchor tandem repeat GloVer-containing protein [Bryobacteraceae bacterium]|jgi:uncharacterized repeat protein (TIGR03803 family)